MKKELRTEWLRLLGPLSSVGIFRTDKEGEMVYANRHCCALAGLGLDEFLGTGWQATVHPEDQQRVFTAWEAQIARTALYSCEYRCCLPEGGVRWIRSQALEMPPPESATAGVWGIAVDLTPHFFAHEPKAHGLPVLELAQTEQLAIIEQMREMLEHYEEAIINSDLQGRITLWNRAATRIFGYSAQEMIGRSTLDLTPPELQNESSQLKQRVRQGEGFAQMETTRLTKDGRRIDVALSVIPMQSGQSQVTGSSAMVRDITPRKAAERRAVELSRQLMHAQDEERRRLARDIHDSTAQTVVAAGLNLSALRLAWRDMAPERREALLDQTIALANQAADELRTLCFCLYPSPLAEGGFAAALPLYAREFANRCGIPVSLGIEPDLCRLDEEVETALFRIVQESLSNVHRHAKAPCASISVSQQENWICVEIADTGTGFPVAERSGTGVGISGMKERMAQIGGVLSIESTPHGTTVRAQLPLPRPEADC